VNMISSFPTLLDLPFPHFPLHIPLFLYLLNTFLDILNNPISEFLLLRTSRVA
jgi:hypothetical protein